LGAVRGWSACGQEQTSTEFCFEVRHWGLRTVDHYKTPCRGDDPQVTWFVSSARAPAPVAGHEVFVFDSIIVPLFLRKVHDDKSRQGAGSRHRPVGHPRRIDCAGRCGAVCGGSADRRPLASPRAPDQAIARSIACAELLVVRSTATQQVTMSVLTEVFADKGDERADLGTHQSMRRMQHPDFGRGRGR